MSHEFTDRVAVITGAARGIGLAIARETRRRAARGLSWWTAMRAALAKAACRASTARQFDPFVADLSGRDAIEQLCDS